MLNHGELIRAMIETNPGVIFVCGSTPLKKGVTESLSKILEEGHNKDLSRLLLEQGRIMFECFGN